MSTRLITTLLAVFSAICLSHGAFQPGTALAQAGDAYQVSAVNTDIASDSITLVLIGNTPPAYTVSERFDPFRLVVDIAKAEFTPTLNVEEILPENDIANLHISLLKDQVPSIARLEFTIDENSTYDVQRQQDNIMITLTAPEKPVGAATVAAAPRPVRGGAQTKPEDIFDAPKGVDLLQPGDKSPQSEVDQMRDSFSFSGYNTERISVDFYKIDLHNVFRLFRQISNLNIIVDEAVQGSITLALNDVPWDFALDIVLNLADLQKEERYNTIVIYPKNKQFAWPERAMDNLSFEADSEIVEEEALIIQESATQPVEIMQAKELLVKGRDLEKDEDYEEAAALYEQAYKLWPDNTRIANKLANLYLGRLNMNAKAYHFAQKALEKEPGNTRAALYSAISSANMDRIPEAMEFFAQSISGDPPMKEALISYAAFSENNNQPEAALKLLDTYSKYYGDNLHTMVSKARIYDKIGATQEATSQYRALLTSGFQMRPDLREYAEARVAAGNF